MKHLFRVLFALLIVLALAFALCFAISADEGENAPAEVETATEEENGLSRLETLWIALMPSVGAVITAAAVAFKIFREFKALRSDVINDAEIASLKKENRALQSQVQRLVELQEREMKEHKSLNESVKSMEITAQKLDLHMTRIEASMNEPEKDVMGHL